MNMVKLMKKLLSIICATLLCVCSGCSKNQAGAVSPYVKVNNFRDLIGGSDEAVYACTAEAITNSEIKYSPIANIKHHFTKKKFTSQLTETLKRIATEENSLLYQYNGCYVSTYGVGMFDVKENNTANILHCFVFTESLENVGELQFYKFSGKLEYSLVFRDVFGGSDILEKLCDNINKRYIVLTTGSHYAMLDDENILTGMGSRYIDILGDCYNALDENELSVSYGDIINDDNLIWINF